MPENQQEARLTEGTLADLVPMDDDENARQHTSRNIGMIVNSLQETGPGRSLTTDENNKIVAGNGTYEAAAQAGFNRVYFADIPDDAILVRRRRFKDEDQKTLHALYDNRTAELAVWNTPRLRTLDEEGMLGKLFTPLEKMQILPAMEDSVRPAPGRGGDEYDTTPGEGPTRAQTGDVWTIGDHWLICGDATHPAYAEFVAYLAQPYGVELVLADPPYNLGMDYGEGTDDAMSDADYRSFTLSWWNIWRTLSPLQIVTPGIVNTKMWYRETDPLWQGTWIRSNSMSHGIISRFLCTEPVLFFGEIQQRIRPSDTFNFPVSEQRMADGTKLTHLHPCPKPMALWMDLLENYSRKGDIIVDPFGGSGTLTVAAHRTQRRAISIEKSRAFCDVHLSRALAEGIGPVQRVGRLNLGDPDEPDRSSFDQYEQPTPYELADPIYAGAAARIW